MVWVYYLLLLVASCIGVGFTVLTLPGLWLIVAASAAYAWVTGGLYLGLKTLIVLLALAAAAEAGDLVLGGRGAKRAGGSGWGILGGTLGGIAGGIFLTALVPVLGTIIGICVGTFAGTFGAELLMGKPVLHSLRIGGHSAKGKLIGIAAKITTGVVMLLIVLVAGFPRQ
jgi:uncharacterized protein YqgC (DUF456 family)